MQMQRNWFLVGVMWIVVFVSSAHADKTGQAKSLFDEASAAFALGKFADAAQLYERAFELKPDPALLYNAAQAHRIAGNRDRALLLYRNYVRVFGARVHNVDEVEKQIARLEEAIETDSHAATSPPTNPIPLGSAEAPSAEPRAAASDPPAATKSPEPAAVPALTLEAKAAPRRPAYKRWWVWTIVGGAAAALAIGLGVGLTRPASVSTDLGTVHPNF
jgi:tetratricopeptide (TPR) repeat protein